MKIKKRYVFAVIMILSILIYSLHACYNKNYALYSTELKKNLKYTSLSAAESYSNYFNSLENNFLHLLSNLEKYNGIDNNFEKNIAEFKKINPSISYISVINEEGSVLYGDTPIQFSDKNLKDFLSHDSSQQIDCSHESISLIHNKINIIRKLNIRNNKFLAISGIAYEEVNNLYDNDSFKLSNGYMFLLSKCGTILVHPNKDLIGLNFFEDKDELMDKLKMTEDNIHEFTSFLDNSNGRFSQGEIHYNAFNTKKIGYYTELEDFKGYSISTIDLGEWKKKILYMTIINILPIIVTFLMALCLLIRYIYEIKYTDYFTGVLNSYAFNYFILKHFKRNGPTLNILLLKIDNMIDLQDNSLIYNGEVFVDVSNYFRSLKRLYNIMFRVSKEHYLFVVKSDTYNLHHFKILYDLIHENINGNHYKEFNIKCEALAVKITDGAFDKSNLIDNLIKHMENRTILKPIEVVDDYNFIVYKKRKCSKFKSVIEQAIAENKIVPFYQPIFNIKENRIEKYEVLMRIKQDDTYLSPKPYTDIAENNGLISKIDEIVIQKAFLYAYKVKYIFKEDIHLTLNLSVKEINTTFINKILNYKDKYKIIPENITFEITETSSYSDLHFFVRQISKLKNAGFKIAIDDFGTGYSNISQLDCLNVDILKIDGRYIRNLHTNEKDRKMLKAFVDIANIYDAKIVAEFVESLETYNVLKEFGVDYAQGYFIGRPEISIPDFHIETDTSHDPL
ncbi:EAL domain-containing protein [Wukongibacter baidiensis]|uniref:EAL domain-containing protein n=1 Tax=Wukongibacter baidiensis TaxID=1723361 RepID=UPI003D7F704E